MWLSSVVCRISLELNYNLKPATTAVLGSPVPQAPGQMQWKEPPGSRRGALPRPGRGASAAGPPSLRGEHPSSCWPLEDTRCPTCLLTSVSVTGWGAWQTPWVRLRGPQRTLMEGHSLEVFFGLSQNSLNLTVPFPRPKQTGTAKYRVSNGTEGGSEAGCLATARRAAGWGAGGLPKLAKQAEF